jgi:DNA polymerase-3 subunit delta
MADRASKALAPALKHRDFAPAYYFHGDDDFRKELALRHLLDAVVDPATRDFNCDTRRGAELDAEQLASLLGTPPMMAERRAVVVRDVTALRKDARAALERALRHPSPDVVLVMLAPAGAKPEKVLCDGAVEVPFEPLREADLPDWIVRWARRELRATVTAPAAALLAGAVGNDLHQLAQELDKLCSYASGQPGAAADGTPVIDEGAVAAVVGVRRGETLADLLDAVARQDVGVAVGLVPHVLAQPKASAVTVVMALSTQMLALAWGQARRAEGASASALVNEFFGLLKESSSAYLGRPWGDATRAWAQAVDRWSAPALDRALQLLLDADHALKETRLSNDEQLLTGLVLALCALEPRGAGGRRAA